MVYIATVVKVTNTRASIFTAPQPVHDMMLNEFHRFLLHVAKRVDIRSCSVVMYLARQSDTAWNQSGFTVLSSVPPRYCSVAGSGVWFGIGGRD
jgi:hypothetical protein